MATVFCSSTEVLDPNLIPKLTCLVSVISVGTCVFLFMKQPHRIHPLVVLYILYFLYSISLLSGVDNNSDGVIVLCKDAAFVLLLNILINLYFNKKHLFLVHLQTILIVVSSILLGYGAYQYVTIAIGQDVTHLLTYRISSFLGHRNLFSQFLLLSLFLSSGILMKKWKTLLPRVSIFIFFILSVMAILVLQTRTVWLSLAIGGTIVIASILFYVKEIEFKKSTLTILFSFLGSITAGCLVYYFTGDLSSIFTQIYTAVKFNHGGVNDRIELWSNSLLLFADAPILGSGLANWKIEILKFGVGDTLAQKSTIYFQRAHNDFLQLLVERGLIGLILFLTVLIYSGWMYLSQIHKSKGIYQPELILLFGGFVAYLGISFFSFPNERIELRLLSICLFVPIILNDKDHFLIINKVWKWLLVIISFAILTISVNRFIGEVKLKKGFEYRAQLNSQLSTELFEIAKQHNLLFDPYSTPLDWYIGTELVNLNQIDSASIYFKKAYKHNPYHIHVLNNLASAESINGNLKKSKELLYKSTKINPYFEKAWLNLSFMYFNEGHLDSNMYCFSKYAELNGKDAYSAYQQKFCSVYLNHLVDNELDETLKRELVNIKFNTAWQERIFKKAIIEHRPFGVQVLLDAQYAINQNGN